MIRVGFIGTGNMGGALAQAVSRSGQETEILLSNRTPGKAEKLAALILAGAAVNSSTDIKKSDKIKVTDNAAIAAGADYIFLGVKPQMMADMLKGISDVLKERAVRGSGFILVTMAAGLSITDIQRMAGGAYPVIRIMPNTPAAIGEGMVLYSVGEGISADTVSEFRSLLEKSGRLSPIDERLIDAGSAVSGCGPAYVYMFIEALADGAVLCGLPRAAAYELAAQMTAGAARMVLEKGSHPGELKDSVCSPGGTTIEGVRALEAKGFRSAVMEAVIAAYRKNSSIG